MLRPRRRWPGWSGFWVAPLSWSGRLSTLRVPGRLDKCSGWASTWLRMRRGTCFRTRFRSMGRCRSGMNREVSYGLLSSCCGGWPPPKPGRGCMACGRRWPTWCGRRTPVSAADHRTVGELLADGEQLARETLLDATPDHAPAMVRSWNQLVRSAAELWAVVPLAPDNPSGLDPMERLRAVGEAIGRSVTAGHWPGQGPTDERLTEIADNLSRARHLVEPHDRHPQQAPPETQRGDIQDRHGQVMHTLYVAAQGTAVALGAHVTDLQHRLAAGEHRRQRLAERPTALEIKAAQDMIARFVGFEQLAGAYLFGLPPTSANHP